MNNFVLFAVSVEAKPILGVLKRRVLSVFEEEQIAKRRISRYSRISSKQPYKRLGVAYGEKVSGISAYPRAVRQTARAMIASSELGFKVVPAFDLNTPLQKVGGLLEGTHHAIRIDRIVLAHPSVTDVVIFDGWDKNPRARNAVNTAIREKKTVHDFTSKQKAVA